MTEENIGLYPAYICDWQKKRVATAVHLQSPARVSLKRQAAHLNVVRRGIASDAALDR